MNSGWAPVEQPFNTRIEDQSRRDVWVPHLSMLAHHARLLQVSIFCMATWVWAWMGLALFEPAWYTKLKTDTWRRAFVVGMILGLCFKMMTIPSCALSAYMTPPEDDVAGIHPSMNEYQQICWGLRGSTIVLELFHYMKHMELVIHHGLVLMIMILTGIFNGPHRGVDLSLGALVSEFPSLTFCIIKELGLIGGYPSLEWALLVAGAGLTLAFRVPATFIGMAMLPATGLRGGPRTIVLVGYVFYLVYNLNISLRRLRKAQILQRWQSEDGDWDFGIRINSRFMISSTSFFAGLVTLGLQVLALALFSIFDSATKDRLRHATWLSVPALLITGLVLQWNEKCRGLLAEAAHQVMSIKTPNMGLITRVTLLLWMPYFLWLALMGEVPAAHNKHLDPKDIVADSPPFCELVLTWDFWFCATAVLLLPMFMVRAERGTRSRGTGKGDVLVPHGK